MLSEPQHTQGYRTTATSSSEGRMKVDTGAMRGKKRKMMKGMLKNMRNDGMGGYGMKKSKC